MEKCASFKSLTSAMLRQINVHDTVALISVIIADASIGVTTAFIESSNLKDDIISRVANISHYLVLLSYIVVVTKLKIWDQKF